MSNLKSIFFLTQKALGDADEHNAQKKWLQLFTPHAFLKSSKRKRNSLISV